MSGQDPYSILGIPPNADEQTIHRAYRELAMQWHPDKNPDRIEEAQAKFTSINEAYQILRDPVKRKTYDLSTPIPSRPSARKPRPGSFVPPRGPSRFGSTSFDQLYNRFYGQPGSHSGCEVRQPEPQVASGSMARSQSQRIEVNLPSPTKAHDSAASMSTDSLDIRIVVNCTLEEMYRGEAKVVKIERTRENGQIETKTIKLTLTPGVHNKPEIRVPGQGNKESGRPPGDLIFTIVQTPHDRFRREGDNIVEHITVTLKDALSCPFPVNSVAIDGDPINCVIDEVIQPGMSYKVHGRGLKSEDLSRGDHIFVFDVVIPLLSDDQRERVIAILSE